MFRRSAVRLLSAVSAMFVCGCFSTSSPYDHLANWLIREDPIRPFVVPADVIYVQGELYLSAERVPNMYLHANSEVGNGRFYGIARVFSPLFSTQDDLEDAIDWYFKYHHEGDRSFVFIGEGEGGRMLREYEASNECSLRRKGLVASFYTEEPHDEDTFVNDEMVAKIRAAVARANYRKIWGRCMPEGMQSREPDAP